MHDCNAQVLVRVGIVHLIRQKVRQGAMQPEHKFLNYAHLPQTRVRSSSSFPFSVQSNSYDLDVLQWCTRCLCSLPPLLNMLNMQLQLCTHTHDNVA